MSILLNMPVAFTDSLGPIGSAVVVFCATWLGIITLALTIIFIWMRPIPESGLFAPLSTILRRLRDFFAVVFSCVFAYVAVFILKDYFKIVRPSVWHVDMRALLTQTDFGFPSGHATFYSALAVALLFIDRRVGKVAVVIALVIGAARVASGVHTPMDILGGYILGTIVAGSIGLAINTVSKKAKK